jgi:signal transduction histidine kinase
MDPDDRIKWEQAVDRAIREKSDYELDYRITLPDGTTKYLHVLGHPILDASGHLVQFMGSVTDVTERKRAEQERERLRQMETELARINRISAMGELTASLAHEINQPIAAAVTNANTSVRWLANDVPNVQEAREAAKRAALSRNAVSIIPFCRASS